MAKGADVNAKGDYGRTALIVAAGAGSREVVELLIAAKADINGLDDFDCTPFISAVYHGHAEVVKVLMEAGADIGMHRRFTALHVAASHGHAEVVKVLLAAKADVNAKDECGGTALMNAAEEGHTVVVKILLAAGADISARNQQGYTALVEAKKKKRAEVVKLLLSAKDRCSQASLIGAASYGHTATVRRLLASKADVNGATDENGNTALLRASSEGHAETAQVLLAANADINAKNNNEDTALICAARNNHVEVVKVLVAGGADTCACNKSGDMAVTLALLNQNAEIVRAIAASETSNQIKATLLADAGSLVPFESLVLVGGKLAYERLLNEVAQKGAFAKHAREAWEKQANAINVDVLLAKLQEEKERAMVEAIVEVLARWTKDARVPLALMTLAQQLSSVEVVRNARTAAQRVLSERNIDYGRCTAKEAGFASPKEAASYASDILGQLPIWHTDDVVLACIELAGKQESLGIRLWAVESSMQEVPLADIFEFWKSLSRSHGISFKEIRVKPGFGTLVVVLLSERSFGDAFFWKTEEGIYVASDSQYFIEAVSSTLTGRRLL